MDINRIYRAADAIVVGTGELHERLSVATGELRTLRGTAAPEVEDRLGPLLEDAREALEVRDSEAMETAAWSIVRFRIDAEESGVR